MNRSAGTSVGSTVRTLATLLAPATLALLAPGVGRDMAAMYERVDANAPYFPLSEPLLVYARMPLAVLGVAWLVLAPGMMLALASDLARSFAEFLLHAFALTLVVLIPVVALARAVAGDFGATGAFALLLFAATLCAVWLLVRRRSGWAPPAWLADRAARREALVAVGAALVFVVALAPKFFWESFNGDGAHAFEASRLLLTQSLPFWRGDAGAASAFPGVNTALFTFPNSWFMQLFGPFESAVRLPFALYLVVLYAGLVAVIEHGAPRALTTPARLLIGAGVASFGLVMSFSATYDPYCADIALPATQDALLVIVFLGAVLSFQRGAFLLCGLFAAMALTTSPNGALLLGAWLGGVVLAWRPFPLRKLVVYFAALAAAALVVAMLSPVLSALGAATPGAEHSSGNLLAKFRYVQYVDVGRLVFLIVPAGIYPALGLLAWRRADAAARAWIAASVAIFGFYYVLAFVSLHYFVPAMLGPLVVFWRVRLFARDEALLSKPALAMCTVLAGTAIVLGLPVERSIYTAGRDVGASIEIVGVDGYERSEVATFRAADLLSKLFVAGWKPEVPEHAYAGSALVWNHYAHRSRSETTRRLYRLQSPMADADLGGAQLLAENSDAHLFLLDDTGWQEQRAQRPAGSHGRALYAVPRDILFSRRAPIADGRVLDLKSWWNAKASDAP